MWHNHPFSQINKATKRAVEVEGFFGGGAGEGGGKNLKMGRLGNIGGSS